ncbi:POU domain protein [Fasciolopsis buskii]|uniref:POU domain protein n=1 Tax=Fasciolopsis buskii TaxID=27845 RepID=A0A8E0S338_9TREM|nr:POU domain protein [Fasciolopsis buski]
MPTGPSDFESQILNNSHSTRPTEDAPWSVELYRANLSPKSTNVMGNLHDPIHDDSTNTQTQSNCNSTRCAGVDNYLTLNETSYEEDGHSYRSGGSEQYAGRNRLDKSTTEASYNRLAFGLNMSDLDTEKCPNITITSYGWKNSQAQLPFVISTNSTKHLGNSYLGSPSKVQDSEDEEQNEEEEQSEIRVGEKMQSSELAYQFTEQSYSRQPCTRLWPADEIGTYNKPTSLLVDDTNSQWLKCPAYLTPGDVCIECDSSVQQMPECIHSSNGSSLSCPRGNRSKCPSQSPNYLPQLGFPPHDTWYHSLGLLSAFTQILAPSRCSSGRVDQRTGTNTFDQDSTCQTPEDPVVHSPLSQMEFKPHDAMIPSANENNTWPQSLTANHPFHTHSCSDKFDEDQTRSELGVVRLHDGLFGNLSDTTLDELRNFACKFKQRRMKLGVTQAEVGRALGRMQLGQFGCLSQSTICRFESLTLSHNNMLVLKPILEKWLDQMETCARLSAGTVANDVPFDFVCHSDGVLETERRRRRTSITEPEKRMLEAYFQMQPKPTSEELGRIANGIRLRKSVVRVWFCNQRQKQKRMQLKQNLSHTTTQLGKAPISDTSVHVHWFAE